MQVERLREFVKRENCQPKDTESKAPNNPLPIIVVIFSSKMRRVIRQELMPRGLVEAVQYSFTTGSSRPIDEVISLSYQDNRELDHPPKDALILALEIISFFSETGACRNRKHG